MAKPVFFSMGGEADTRFAKAVKDLLPDPMVYFYQRSGEEGTNFRPEIEAEVQGCRVFVLFWSNDYLKSEHARQELAIFKKTVEAGHDADLLIVPTTRRSPDIQREWTNPINSSTEYMLGRWRYERSVFQGEDPQRVVENIRRKLAKARLIDRALVVRPGLLAQFKAALSRPNYQTVQFCLVWGFEGDGRRTALRQYMTTAHVNLTPRYVPLDTTEGPEDLLLRLHDHATPKQRQEILKAAQGKRDGVGKAIRTALFIAGESKSYYVIVLSRFTGTDSGTLPPWLADVFGNIPPGNAPLAFVVVPNPVSDAQMRLYPLSARTRVQGLDEDEMNELVHKLSQEDSNPGRWTEERRKIVARVSGSSPSLCHAIMYAMSTEPTLDFLGRIADREADIFSANISALIGHLVGQLKGRPGDLLALRLIERLGATSKQTLDAIFASRSTTETYDLYQLRDYGLVEHLSGDIYRIPPLVQRRLGDALWSGGLSKEEVDSVLGGFAREIITENDEYGAVFASNKVAAQLRTNAPVPVELASYLTTATLFKAGLERYTSNEFPIAHSILQRAMRRLKDGTNLDPLTQIEIARYYGLAAARIERFDDVAVARSFLRDGAVKSRSVQAEAMVEFLDGFEARVRWRSRDAVRSFERARRLLHHVRFAERQRGAVLTELSRALLRLDPPAYDRAVSIAEEAYEQMKVVHNLNGVIRARLARLEGALFDGPSRTFQQEVKKIDELLDLLTEMCRRSSQDFHLVRRADISRILSYKKVQSGESKILNLTEAIRFTDQAIELKKFPPTIARRWYLRLFDQTSNHAQELIKEAEETLRVGDVGNRVHLKDALVVAVISHARINQEDARRLLREHRDLVNDGFRQMLTKMIVDHGRLGGKVTDYSRLDRM
ncbi:MULTISPECIES: TIR domain-containing protein [unclassified Burkholderia]|uniref:TIR domain-containing protein n=1 Tax=unclassified Burkholderia TaxID=2613784 RepID=UPI00141F0318|nr:MULTISPECIES: TIR domain-containing protein [unclassified Burkholderia]NIE84668.1 TIR domain-containing protein [Burkholderia sp. Tr-860]NIF63574.1 TIR domain-containing protein [Burkholderia sp. Cy-647]NIF97643.1 TIR domain-containing protein [Burkholderia sp. Ax-1720]